MPTVIQCPSCDRKLRVPDDFFGKKVRCPGCKTAFTAEAPEEEPLEEAPQPSPRRSAPPREERIDQRPSSRGRPIVRKEEEDEDNEEENHEEEEEVRPSRRRVEESEDISRSRGKRERWQNIVRGLTFIITSFWVVLGISIIGGGTGGIVKGMMSASNGPNAVQSGSDSIAGTFIILASIVLARLAGAGLTTFGHYLCLTGPNKPGSDMRKMVVTSFSLTAAWAGFTVLSTIVGVVDGISGAMTTRHPLGAMNFSPLGGVINGILNILCGLCLTSSSVTFIYYLRAVAFAMRREGLAKTLMIFLIVASVAILLGIILSVVVLMLVGSAVLTSSGENNQARAAGALMGGLCVGVGFGCTAAIIGLGLFIWYIVLLFQVRGAVKNYLLRE